MSTSATTGSATPLCGGDLVLDWLGARGGADHQARAREHDYNGRMRCWSLPPRHISLPDEDCTCLDQSLSAAHNARARQEFRSP
jgi:hypothetical protein